jgi:hypothetical protein
MSKRFDEVIQKVRALPEHDQEQVAEVLMAVLETHDRVAPLSDDDLETVKRTQEAVRRGEVATDQEMDELWRRFGLA